MWCSYHPSLGATACHPAMDPGRVNALCGCVCVAVCTRVLPTAHLGRWQSCSHTAGCPRTSGPNVAAMQVCSLALRQCLSSRRSCCVNASEVPMCATNGARCRGTNRSTQAWISLVSGAALRAWGLMLLPPCIAHWCGLVTKGKARGGEGTAPAA